MANGIFAGGSGTIASPFLVEDVYDLNEIRKNITAFYKLTNDINMNIAPFNTGEGWLPIGLTVSDDGNYTTSVFTGSIFGEGYTIYNLMINRPTANNIGLFASASATYGNTTTEIFAKNLYIKNANIIGGDTVGALCGSISYTSIEDCHVKGNIKGNKNIGGIVGNFSSDDGFARKISFDGTVEGKDSYVGGIAGYTNSVKLRNVIVKGNVNSDGNYIGGIVGQLGYNSSLNNSISTAVVSSTYFTGFGGMVGGVDRNGSSLVNYWDIDINTTTKVSAIGTALSTVDLKKASTFSNLDSELDSDGVKIWYIFDGYYPSFEYPFYRKFLIKESISGILKSYNFDTSEWFVVNDNTVESFINQGINTEDLPSISSENWNKLPKFQLLYYTENSNASTNASNVLVETEPYSVYDYISENPQAVIYTELTDDITVSTTTEPYTIYDEFGDEVEVLYYTDDNSVTEADLILEANYSPIDELDGDLEVVTWTDESSDTAKRILEVTGTHKPIFTYPINPLEIKGELQNLVIQETSESKDVRYLISNNNSTWYKWDVDKFVVVDQSQVDTIGMTLADLMTVDYSKWVYDKINVGVYLTNDSMVKKIELTELVPNKSSKVSDLHFYILNTTAKIDIELRGNTIMGQVTDDDSSKVQYRVTLNGGYYYPTTGSYTALSDSPSNINLTLRSQDIKISEWNDLKVEFKDSFGTVDSWEIQFIGQYDGLLFKTTDGEFYSSDIGEVLRYLDFGLIIAGQTTMEHEVVLKNQYGYGVKDVGLSVVESNLPSGVKVEFSNDGVENWQSKLPVATTMNSNEQVTFRVRMRTELTSEPRSNGSFDIYVNALKDE